MLMCMGCCAAPCRYAVVRSRFAIPSSQCLHMGGAPILTAAACPPAPLRPSQAPLLPVSLLHRCGTWAPFLTAAACPPPTPPSAPRSPPQSRCSRGWAARCSRSQSASGAGTAVRQPALQGRRRCCAGDDARRSPGAARACPVLLFRLTACLLLLLPGSCCSVIVMYDAMGIRRHAGLQAQVRAVTWPAGASNGSAKAELPGVGASNGC